MTRGARELRIRESGHDFPTLSLPSRTPRRDSSNLSVGDIRSRSVSRVGSGKKDFDAFGTSWCTAHDVGGSQMFQTSEEHRLHDPSSLVAVSGHMTGLRELKHFGQK
mmetsp:Transcript_1436/g.3860  ORF Transcript_1436/g.3860 Transcript_1436/m.3860 type:complete len:107 (+) Transcript_1436:879-1199(+)